MFDKIENLKKNLNQVIHGKEDAIELMLVAFCSGGNLLMEDVPGVGKTTLAKALAKSISGDFHRVQFTPDLLPADIVGTSIYNPRDACFEFRKGPVFTNILLADEINRASPRTQSALLEAMNESQVTIEGKTYPLIKPFMVIATQNPIEYHGTYPLPEAQLDRFAMQLVLGYPDEENEVEIVYSRKEKDPLDTIEPVIDCEHICKILERVRKVDIEKSVAQYMLSIIRATREDVQLKLGASPRAFISLSRCAQAMASLEGRDYVLPDDVKKLAIPVLTHRLVLDNKAKYSGVKKESVVEGILERIDVPV